MFSMTGDPPMLKSFPSAFQPPAVSKSLFSPGHNLFPGPRPPGLVSPASDHSSEPRSELRDQRPDVNLSGGPEATRERPEGSA